MFSKISRYRKLPDEVTVDADGFSFQSKSLRLTPDVDGTFQHTVEEIDRLDHLGYKYYKQPRKWWRICDANPEFLSPQAMLGKEPIVTGEFPVEFGGGDPPYAVILAAVRNLVGVENALLGAEDAILGKEVLVTGEFPVAFDVADPPYEAILTALREEIGVKGVLPGENDASIIVTFNTMTTEAAISAAIVEAAVDEGLDPNDVEVSAMTNIGRVNNSIVVTFNTMTTTDAKIAAAIVAAAVDEGIDVSDVEVLEMKNIGRVGKKIIVPPDSLV